MNEKDEETKNEDFVKAKDYEIQPISENYKKNIEQRLWNLLHGELTEHEQIRFKYPHKKIQGILVRCPSCGKVQITQSLKSKHCAICNHSFKIITERNGSRIVWIPKDKRGIFERLYNVTIHGKLYIG